MQCFSVLLIDYKWCVMEWSGMEWCVTPIMCVTTNLALAFLCDILPQENIKRKLYLHYCCVLSQCLSEFFN